MQENIKKNGNHGITMINFDEYFGYFVTSRHRTIEIITCGCYKKWYTQHYINCLVKQNFGEKTYSYPYGYIQDYQAVSRRLGGLK